MLFLFFCVVQSNADKKYKKITVYYMAKRHKNRQTLLAIRSKVHIINPQLWEIVFTSYNRVWINFAKYDFGTLNKLFESNAITSMMNFFPSMMNFFSQDYAESLGLFIEVTCQGRHRHHFTTYRTIFFSQINVKISWVN